MHVTFVRVKSTQCPEADPRIAVRSQSRGTGMRLTSVLLASCSLVCLASPSRCPEPRKPHLTSCTIFYNCANLPGGGYVWVPSRCTEGLVFQPYLRMCVVPGDIWTCDTLSTESAPATKRPEIPKITDAGSYLGYTPDPLVFSGTIDSSYVIDDFTDSTTEAVTAYPLIEFEETTHGDKGVRNHPSYQREENYLYEYTVISQGQLPSSLMREYKDVVDNHYKWLNKLMSRLHVCEEPSVPVRDVTTVNPTQTIAIFASHNRRQNISPSHLVQSYTEGDEPHNGEPNETLGSDGPQMDGVATTSGSAVPTESALELLIDGVDPDNGVISVGDNLGNKQYLTVDRYKAVAHRLASRTVSVVACTRNVRLPNGTDCNRYYTCDPKTAVVAEYSCPPHTAFNGHSRICDVESAKTCAGGDGPAAREAFVVRAENVSATTPDEEGIVPEGRLCRELGKVKDPASDSHYHICYGTPDSEDIKSIRMTCPNTLIFCQSRRVCTTRRLCDASL